MRDFQTVQLRIGTAGAQIDVAGHFSFSTDAQLPSWGLVALGGGFTSPTL